MFLHIIPFLHSRLHSILSRRKCLVSIPSGFRSFNLIYYIIPILFTGLFLIPTDVLSQGAVEPVDVSIELGDKYYDALEYLEKNTWIYDTLVKSNVSPELAFSIIFPSLTRYTALKDIMETSAMRTLYVQSGRKYSKYMVGRFQMKPSFAELVERNVNKYKLGDYKFKMQNNPKARSERARRLDSPQWQVQYLILYTKIMDKRFSHLKWKTPADKVRFYATAFNIGFNKNERTIKYLMSRRSLLRSSKDAKSKLRYGDVAVWFFENDGRRFKSDIPIIPKTPQEQQQKEK